MLLAVTKVAIRQMTERLPKADNQHVSDDTSTPSQEDHADALGVTKVAIPQMRERLHLKQPKINTPNEGSSSSDQLKRMG